MKPKQQKSIQTDTSNKSNKNRSMDGLQMANRSPEYAMVTKRYGPLLGNPRVDTWKLFTPDTIVQLRNRGTSSTSTLSSDQTLTRPSNPTVGDWIRSDTWKVESSPSHMGALRLRNTVKNMYLSQDGLVSDDNGKQTSWYATSSNFLMGDDQDSICLLEVSRAKAQHEGVNAQPLGSLSGALLRPRKAPIRDFDLCKWDVHMVSRQAHHYGNRQLHMLEQDKNMDADLFKNYRIQESIKQARGFSNLLD
jgi:hypothetical protein